MEKLDITYQTITEGDSGIQCGGRVILRQNGLAIVIGECSGGDAERVAATALRRAADWLEAAGPVNLRDTDGKHVART